MVGLIPLGEIDRERRKGQNDEHRQHDDDQ
jgi:hypothetical protein